MAMFTVKSDCTIFCSSLLALRLNRCTEAQSMPSAFSSAKPSVNQAQTFRGTSVNQWTQQLSHEALVWGMKLLPRWWWLPLFQ